MINVKEAHLSLNLSGNNKDILAVLLYEGDNPEEAKLEPEFVLFNVEKNQVDVCFKDADGKRHTQENFAVSAPDILEFMIARGEEMVAENANDNPQVAFYRYDRETDELVEPLYKVDLRFI